MGGVVGRGACVSVGGNHECVYIGEGGGICRSVGVGVYTVCLYMLKDTH